jgi:maleylacetoacetate isomerase
MKLYDYYRSTACYRVRLALHIKHIPYDTHTIHLVNQGGEHHHIDYKTINPQGLVPSLETRGHVLTQSLAIIEYLDECYPNHPLLPKDPLSRATIRALALIIACDMHPLNNLRILERLKQQFDASKSEVQAWYHHWLKIGFDAFEAQLNTLERSAPVCFGQEITLADICLIPQVYNAHRFQFSMEAYPLINKINAYCLTLDAFQKASPEYSIP